MKKIIKGKVYDTSTARKLGMRWIGAEYSRSGLEKLYRKKTGEFFTLYHSYSDNSERIEPLAYEEARCWAEEHLDSDDYISIFGEPEEDSTKTTLNIYLRADTAAKLKAEAGRQGISIGELIEKMMKEDLL